MATSHTHLAVATVAGGFAATAGVAAGLCPPREALVLLGLAAAGGYLPDVDADNSGPLKVAFHWGAVSLAFLALFHAAETHSVAELTVLWLVVYLGIRVLAVKGFEKLTLHRGLFHSVPAALLFSALAVTVCHRGFGWDAGASWAAGGFLFGGYMSHLLLDEGCALNLFGIGTRNSLGSACKLWHRPNLRGTLWLYTLAAAALLSAPSPTPFLDSLTDPETLRALGENLWPRGGWFGNSGQ